MWNRRLSESERMAWYFSEGPWLSDWNQTTRRLRTELRAPGHSTQYSCLSEVGNSTAEADPALTLQRLWVSLDLCFLCLSPGGKEARVLTGAAFGIFLVATWRLVAILTCNWAHLQERCPFSAARYITHWSTRRHSSSLQYLGIFYPTVWHFGASEASSGWFRASYASFTRATQRCICLILFGHSEYQMVCCLLSSSIVLLRWWWTRHWSLRMVNSSPLVRINLLSDMLSLHAVWSASRITCSNSFWNKWHETCDSEPARHHQTLSCSRSRRKGLVGILSLAGGSVASRYQKYQPWIEPKHNINIHTNNYTHIISIHKCIGTYFSYLHTCILLHNQDEPSRSLFSAKDVRRDFFAFSVIGTDPQIPMVHRPGYLNCGCDGACPHWPSGRPVKVPLLNIESKSTDPFVLSTEMYWACANPFPLLSILFLNLHNI